MTQRTSYRLAWLIRWSLLLWTLVLSGGPSAQAQTVPADRFLGKEDILLYGMGLTVEPAHQTVPKNIATIVSTYLQVPILPAGQIPPLPADAVVMATLRGPTFATPLELSVQANTPFSIPPLTVPGVHTLENIRIVSGGQVLLYGNPENVTLNCIDKLLITEVTARPLTADEIRAQGIVFDRSNFQAYNFSAAFAVSPGQNIAVNFPVILPTLASTQNVTVSTSDIPMLSPPQLPNLATIIPDTLRMAQTQIPNLQVHGFTLKVDDVRANKFEVPSVPGVVVIPGDIGFLNQYFSVMLMVGNGAPAGANLVVQDLHAEIVLPAGNDTVVGTTDDPLQMAVTERGVSSRIQPVTRPGPDGKLGTADDIGSIAPGESGNAEYLVEGRREGTHTVEMEITGTLVGLPIGPVTVRGRAVGAVLVRNPSFTLTFTHPDIVNAGEEYTLDITVTNTSDSPANFVSVNLYPRNISGATLVGEPTQEVESIPPGDSATVGFALRSNVTGTVFAATLDSDDKVAGRFQLKTSVGELGIPLSPDSLVLPKEANALPKNLRDAAIGLLGKAYAAATAPNGALPKDMIRFSKKIVWDRAIETAEAGFRYSLHEPLTDSAKQLWMDFMGNNAARLSEIYPVLSDRQIAETDFPGFDDLRRRSVRGDTLAGVIAGLLMPDLTQRGLSAFHQDFAEKVSYRPSHLSVGIATDGGGPLPFELVLVDDQGRKLGGVGAKGKVVKEIPFGDYLNFMDSQGVATGEMAIASVPQGTGYRILLQKVSGVPDDTPFSLSIVTPDISGGMRHLFYSNVNGLQIPNLSVTASDPYPLSLEMLFGGIPRSMPPVTSTFNSPVSDPLPTVIGVVQQAEADKISNDCGTWRFGRVVAVLFSEEVTADSVQDKVRRELLTNYQAEENEVVGISLQPDRRIAFMALRDPLGPFIPRQITMTGVRGISGQTMVPWTGPIEPTLDVQEITDEAGAISGKVLQADGTPVGAAEVRLFTGIYVGLYCDFTWYGVSTKQADGEGRYGWDLVLKNNGTQVSAIDPETQNSRSLRLNMSRHGQRLNVDMVFLGRGMLQGRTFAEDGVTPLSGTDLRVTSLTDYSEYGAKTDLDGRFVIAGIPVGNILIEGVHVGTQSKVIQSDYIGAAGGIFQRDLVLLTEQTRQSTIQYGAVSGYVLRSDGATPVPALPVMLYYQNGSQAGVDCPHAPDNPPPAECPAAIQKTDGAGGFSFGSVVAGDLRVYAFDQSRFEEGNARVILTANGSTSANILLNGGLGSVRGIVLDADGNPVSGASVGGGLSLTTTDAQGQFVLSDVPVGHRDIVAVSQSLGARGNVVVDIAAQGDTVGSTIVLGALGSVYGTVYAADGVTPVPNLAVYLWKPTGDAIQVVATSATDNGGHYRIDQVPVSADNYTLSAFLADFTDGNVAPVAMRFSRQVTRADVVFKGGGGKIRGVILDADGQTPLKARVAVSGLRVMTARGQVGMGYTFTQYLKVVDNDLTTGRFSFDNLFVGPVVVTAAGPFSPDPVTFSGEIPSAGSTVDVALRLQPTSQVRGVVYQPDGVTTVGRDVVVTFKSDEFRTICEVTNGETQCRQISQGIQEEIVVTDDLGQFWLPIVNAGSFTIRVQDPVTGKFGRISGTVPAGQTGQVSVRLVGLGDVTIQVIGSDGVTHIPGARVTLEQTEYPHLKRIGFADAMGVIMFGGGDALPEGPFVVLATDIRNGFAGRAFGRVTQDGETVTVRTFLYNATGSVTGMVVRPDGYTPVPNAEVQVYNAQGPLAFGVTDGFGNYRVDLIPLGPVSVETFEAATGRRGNGSGRIDLANQEVPIRIVESGIGLVSGSVVAAGTLNPIPGVQVQLNEVFPSGRFLSLNATTGPDGRYSIPGVSLGTFSLYGYRTGFYTTTAGGRVTREGEGVELPLVLTPIQVPLGRIEGWVYNPNGTPASNTLVCLDPSYGTCYRQVTTDLDGHFLIPDVALTRHLLVAQSQVNADTGSGRVDVAFAGQTAYISLAMSGVGNVTGTAFMADGSIAPNVQVTLQKYPDAGCGNVECTTFADGSGTFAFPRVPAGQFTIRADDPISHLSGAVGGSVMSSSGTAVQVFLQPSGSLTGRILLPNGTPVSGVIAELVLSTGTILYTESGIDGRFVFPVVRLGGYTLNLQDPIGPGMARKTGTITGPMDSGDTLLDIAPPSVSSISPVPGAVSVPMDTVIRITFSEPVQPGGITQSHVTLRKADGTTVSGILAVLNGDTVVTFTALTPLQDETGYTLRIEGVTDRLDRVMPQPFVSSFVTVDLTPPSLLDVQPGAGFAGIAIDSVVRVQYSEPVQPSSFSGPAITLSDSNGAVPGRLDLIFGNTVAVFTPQRPLSENMSYHVHLPAATDLSGNVQTSAMDYDFSTTDRVPPTIQGITLSNSGLVIEGGTGMARVELGTTVDVSFVDFMINGLLLFTDRIPPFELAFLSTSELGLPGSMIKISAAATDASGNRGPATDNFFTIVADTEPRVILTSPIEGSVFATGARVPVTVQAVDDLGVNRIGYQAVGGQFPAAAISYLALPATTATSDFAFYVPVDAEAGSSIMVNATAVDSKGQTARAIPVNIIVMDATPPTVTFSGLTTGDRVNPGQRMTAVVSASDVGGITSLTFSAGGAATYTETRPVSPSQNAVVTSFSFTVSPTAGSLDHVVLDVTAVDAAGNGTMAPRIILPVADLVPPVISLRTETGRLDMVPGSTLNVIAEATDDVGVSRIDLTGTGAFPVSDAKGISPPLGSTQTVFAILIPDRINAGDTLILQAKAQDLVGNVGISASLTLTARTVMDLVMPASLLIAAGETQMVAFQLSAPAPAGGIRVDLVSGDAQVVSVVPSVSFPEGQAIQNAEVTGQSGGTTSITASIQGVARGSMTTTVRGGIVQGTVYNPFPVPVAGAEVNVNGLSTVSDADGRFSVEGVYGPQVTVKAFDAQTQLKGYIAGTMARANGFLKGVNVVLIPAGSIAGTVFLPDGQTPAGSGVEVSLYNPNDRTNPMQILFTDGNSQFEFPLVSVGSYSIDATDLQGNHGRSNVTIGSSGQDVTTSVVYLGRGSVTGTVRDGNGALAANTSVVLTSGSLFGGSATTTTGADGTFRFDGVFVGPFGLSARDTVTNLAANASGVITVHQQVVDVTLNLTAYGSVEGYVYRSDGTTPVSGASVTLSAANSYRSTQTDALGYYRVDILPLAYYILNVSDPSTQGIGQGSVTLQTSGETRRVDLTLLGQGTVVVTVQDAYGQPVTEAQVTLKTPNPFSFYSPIYHYGTTVTDGTVVIANVLAGSFTVNVTHSGLTGVSNGSVADGGTAYTTVRLEATATITGFVYGPDGVTPAAGITVNGVTTGIDGRYSLENLRMGTYTLYAYDSNYLLRAKSAGILLNANGQVVTQDLVLVGLGTVEGVVLMPDQSRASNMNVMVRSLNTAFGRTYSVTTDAAGFYRVENVPVGLFTVSTGNVQQQLLGEGSGNVAADGQTVTVDILLQGNAINLPTYLYDGNTSSYDIYADGTMKYGAGRGLFYQNYYYYFSPYRKGGAALEILSGGTTYPFSGGLIAVQEDQGREIVVRQEGLAGLNVTRKVYVPKEGYFARYLEILTNPTAAPLTVDLLIKSNFNDGYTDIGMLTTSNGDNQLQVSGMAESDRWVVVDDTNTGDPFLTYSIPPAAFLWGGPNAGVVMDTTVFSPYTTFPSASGLQVGASQVTIPPGQSMAFMHFVVQQVSREAAQASVERLSELPPEALAGLSLNEMAITRNFAVPLDGRSSLPPLPPLTGTVTGRALADDGITLAPTTCRYYYNGTACPAGRVTVSIKSNNLLFGRTYSRQIQPADYATGTFTLRSDVRTAAYPTVAIPLEGFTLWAEYREGAGVTSSPVLSGSFPVDGSTTAIQDILFTNTGQLQGAVLTALGNPLSGANLTIPYYGDLFATGADGSYRVAFIPPGTYALTVTKTHPQGSPLTAMVSGVVVVAGQMTTMNVSLPPVANIAGVIRSDTGAPTSGARVVLTQDTGGFSRQMYTDTAGQYLLTDVPEGVYTLSAYQPVTNVSVSVTVTVAGGGVISQDLSFPVTGKIAWSVYFADGVTAAGASIEILDGTTGAVLKTGCSSYWCSTDTGYFSTTASSFVVRATLYSYNQQTGANQLVATVEQPVPGFTQSAQVQMVRLTLPVNKGNIQARVLLSNGTVFKKQSVQVEVRNILDDTLLNSCGTSADYWAYSWYYGYRFYPGTGDCMLYDVVAGATEGVKVRATLGTTVVEQVVNFTTSNTVLNVDLTLPLVLASVAGHVTMGDGAPVPYATIEVLRAVDGTLLQTVSASFDGTYTATDMLISSSTEEVIVRATYSGLIQEQRVTFVSGITAITGIDFVLPLSVLKGTVYAGDGATPLGSAYVQVTGASLTAVTSDYYTGTYQTAPFNAGTGTVSISVTWPDICGGECTTAVSPVTVVKEVTFAAGGETRQVDMTLPFSVVKGTVTRQDGVTPVGWPTVFARQTDVLGNIQTYNSNSTDVAGAFVIVGIPQGDFTVSAQDSNSGLTGLVTGTVVDLTQAITLHVPLEPSGSVTGTVLSGGLPVTAGSVQMKLTIPANNFTRYVYAGSDGVYRFDDVPVGNFTLSATDWAPYPEQYSDVVSGTISMEGELVTLDVPLLQPGTVSGTVYGPDGVTPLTNAYYAVVIGNPTLGWTRYAHTDANGFYSNASVPAGNIVVTASTGQNQGSSSGTLTPGGGLVLDVTMSRFNLYYGYYNLDGADGFRYDVMRGGSLWDGGKADGTMTDAYNSAYGISVNGLSFSESFGRPEDVGRELTLGPQTLGGLDVTRKIFVPAEGGFARYLEIVYNPGPDWFLNLQVYAQLGSYLDTIVTTSPIDTGNTYAVTYDNTRSDPALAHAFGQTGAPIGVSLTQFSTGNDNISYQWDQIPIASGETKCVMHFAVQRGQNNEADAAVQALALVDLTDPNALIGMSPQERACVVNFVIP